MQKQVDKIDSKNCLLNENIGINQNNNMKKINIGNNYNLRKFKFNNQIYTSSNYYNIGKLNRLHYSLF